MATRASDQVTLQVLPAPSYVRTYYLLQSSTLNPPAKPTTNPPSSPWTTTEPNYTAGSTDTLYTAQFTAWGDTTFEYGPVQKSSAYEAAKQAYNIAQSAQTAINGASKVIHGTTVPGSTAAPNGSVFFRHKTNLSGPVIGQWSRVAGAWVETPTGSEAIANLDVGKLTSGSATIAELVAKKIAAASGQFLELDVGQLVATDATLAEAVIQKLFADVVVAGTVQADQFIGENAILTGAITAAKLSVTEIWGDEAWLNVLRTGVIEAAMVTAGFGQDLNLQANGSIILALGNAANAQSVADLNSGRVSEVSTRVGYAQEQATAAAESAAEAITASENLGRYYRFDETDLRIGRPGSSAELSISETGISFLQNETPISLWDGGQMIVSRFVGEEVVLANHKIETRGARTIVRSM